MFFDSFLRITLLSPFVDSFSFPPVPLPLLPETETGGLVVATGQLLLAHFAKASLLIDQHSHQSTY